MTREELRVINNLAPEKLNELKKRYYEGEKVSKLIEEFGLVEVGPSQVYLLFDDEVSDTLCPYCFTFMIRKPESRSSYSASNLQCPICAHKKSFNRYDICHCSNCDEKREFERWKFLQTEHSVEYGHFDDLTYTEFLFLGALYLYGRKGEGNSIVNISEQGRNFSFFHEEIEEEIFNSLYNKRFLVVSLENTVDKFHYTADNTFDLEDCKEDILYDLWVADEDLEKLEGANVFVFEDFEYFWRMINEGEATYYLIKLLDNYYFRYEMSQVKSIVQKYIENFSLAETLSIIKYLVVNHSDYRVRRVDRKEAMNVLEWSFDRYYNWAIKNHEKVAEFAKKVSFGSITKLSKYFYEKVLKDKEKFLEPIPKK